MSTSFQPDKKFRVAVVLADDGDSAITIFMPSTGGIPPTADWEKVPGTMVVLAGGVYEATAGLIGNYTNKELGEMLGLHPKTLRAMRVHLGIAADSAGRGGHRPGSGQKKKAATAPPDKERGS